MTPLMLLPFLLAPFIGSFLGVLIRRIPRGETFVSGRSHCETCNRTLGPSEMIPLLSYWLQKGVCRHCGGKIDPLHLKVELSAVAIPACALLVRLVGAAFQGVSLNEVAIDPAIFFADCVLGWGLLALSWIDLDCMRLPDVLTLPLLLAGLCEAVALHGWNVTYDRILGCVAGWLLFSGVAWGYRLLRKRDGLGGGDAKLLAMGGAWLGIAPLPFVVLSASILGIMVAMSTTLRAGRFSMTVVVPFGPSLAAAIWIARLTLTGE
ncbi:peptidase A24 (plasmid) [Kozakia baliensis]|uniref:Prepilin leader peptidase/N-methyltransferase n=2 Tax=Kozakia baliensis TaxID=153496 RepID=A0A1D8UYU9_9PROT|nr:A24 family peptidase [Kozakia baliensis]AOX18853.1 peptidase A24 [Kozakia baliensis]